MQKTEAGFWPMWNSNRARPIDLLVNAQSKERNPITGDTLCDFVYGCQAIAWSITRIQPDFVVYPLRGSVPIDWTVKELARQNPRNYHSDYMTIYPQTGTYFDVETGKAAGMDYKQKEAAIEVELGQIQNMWRERDRDPVVVVIDEVSSGSTLVTAVDIMQKKLRTQMGVEKVYVIGAQDERVLGVRPKTELYTYLAASADEFIELQTVNLPLFFMDVAEFLDYPLSLTPFGVNKPPINHVLHNEEAQAIFTQIARVVQYPEKMTVATTLLKSQGIYAKSSDPMIQENIDYILSLLLPEEITFRLRASNHGIVQFWETLASTRTKQR